MSRNPRAIRVTSPVSRVLISTAKSEPTLSSGLFARQSVFQLIRMPSSVLLQLRNDDEPIGGGCDRVNVRVVGQDPRGELRGRHHPSATTSASTGLTAGVRVRRPGRCPSVTDRSRYACKRG